MNVALTRARSSLFILGNAPTLERSDENWRQIVQDARSRQRMIDATIGYFTSPSNQVPPKPTTKLKGVPVTPVLPKLTESEMPESLLIKPNDTIKPQVKRVNSVNSLSERETNGTTTSTTSVAGVEKPVPPSQANGRPIPGPNRLPAQPQDPRPKKKQKLPPRPNPGASLFIPSKKTTTRRRFGGTEQKTTINH